MIQINGVQIQNFRSFKEKTDTSKFTDNKTINVLTGKNNSGKTNVLRAIRLFFEPEKYCEEKDMNAIKVLTGGSSKHPTIVITFCDDESIGREIKYKIRCDMNQESSSLYSLGYIYKENSYNADDVNVIKSKMKNSNEIRKFISDRFKCVFLSTTDEDIITQANNAIKDMILQFYQQQNKEVKKSIEDFENEYESMIGTFKNNFQDLESKISEGFNAISNEGINIVPRLNITKDMKITDFVLNNLSFTIDDSYNHELDNKGAGIQRSALILLNIFLLKNIYSKKNKIVLLDEPEAFLYPLLISKIKKSLENVSYNNNLQMFLTTHSREFLKEIENNLYSYYNIDQIIFDREYKRSNNQKDIVKKSVITDYNRTVKNQVLRNYGLLNQIDDYDEIIICEGKTDMNYLEKILINEDVIPQIRCNNNYQYNYIGRGAEGILPILSYLNEVSSVKRKIFILVDGDAEGKKIKDKILKEKQNLKNIEEIKVYQHSDDLVIEDVVFSESQYVDRVLQLFEHEFTGHESKFRKYIFEAKANKSVIKKTEQYINDYQINVNIMWLKHLLSTDLDDIELSGDIVKKEITNFFK